MKYYQKILIYLNALSLLLLFTSGFNDYNHPIPGFDISKTYEPLPFNDGIEQAEPVKFLKQFYLSIEHYTELLIFYFGIVLNYEMTYFSTFKNIYFITLSALAP